MTRLEAFRTGKHRPRGEQADIEAIRAMFPDLLAVLTDNEIAGLWVLFSAQEYCAGWMTALPQTIRYFGQWVLMECEL